MRKKLLLLTLVFFGALLLSACGGTARGVTWPGLAADETTAYFADLSFVYGLDLKDGAEVWRFSDPNDNKAQFYATPVLTSDGLVIVGSAGGKHLLYALNPHDLIANGNFKNPAIEWTFAGAGGPWVAPPLVLEDKLFAPNADGYLYVLDLNDGQSQKQPLAAIELGGRLWAQPVTDANRLYVTSLDHRVYAVSLEDYAIVWQADIAAAIPGAPALGPDGTLYVGSLASKLEQFDPESGAHQSVLEAEHWLWSTPTLDDGTLYVGDLKGNFYSFDTASGKLNWSIQPDGAITANAIVQNDHLLLATESGTLYAIGKDGKTLWFEEVGGKIYTTPVTAGDLILIAPLETDFYLAALDSNGRRVWTFPSEK